MASKIDSITIQNTAGDYISYDIDLPINASPKISSLEITDGLVVKGEVVDAANLIEVTWYNLKSLRDGNTLLPGKFYRIIDYTCKTAESNTSSANHVFDIIVLAESTNKLSEKAYAIKREGDTYFSNSKLEAWQLGYCFDNDTTRFAWAVGGAEVPSITVKYSSSEDAVFMRDPSRDRPGSYYQYAWINQTKNEVGYIYREIPRISSDYLQDIKYLDGTYKGGSYAVKAYADAAAGKGVIYRMIDEFGNDCPYDFKNILFTDTNHNPALYTNAYTFSVTESSSFKDASLTGIASVCLNNIINPYITDKQYLNRIVNYSTTTTLNYKNNINLIQLTYDELKTLRDNSQLISGQYYRITDYDAEPQTNSTTHSGRHAFDILVTAISNNMLSYKAEALHHTGDTYFEHCDLSKWELRYSLDLIDFRCIYATKKGQILWMKDEWNNEAPFDFKNILFPVLVDSSGYAYSSWSDWSSYAANIQARYMLNAHDIQANENYDASVLTYVIGDIIEGATIEVNNVKSESHTVSFNRDFDTSGGSELEFYIHDIKIGNSAQVAVNSFSFFFEVEEEAEVKAVNCLRTKVGKNAHLCASDTVHDVELGASTYLSVKKASYVHLLSSSHLNIKNSNNTQGNAEGITVMAGAKYRVTLTGDTLYNTIFEGLTFSSGEFVAIKDVTLPSTQTPKRVYPAEMEDYLC